MRIRNNTSKFLVIFALIFHGIFLTTQWVSISAGSPPPEIPEHISQRITQIFAKADELTALRKQRSQQYLTILSDDQLAGLYAKATAPQQEPPSGSRRRLNAALEKVRKDRQGVFDYLLKWTKGPLDKDDDEAFRNQYAKLVGELAALGPKAVPALSLRMGGDYRRTGHWALAKKALLKMGPSAVEPLIGLMDNPDSYIRTNVAYVLAEMADPRANDVLLRAVEDESGSVRRWAVQGLVKLGPEVVGKHKLVTLLITGLEDGVCLYESIQGLQRYGNETTIEPLSVIEHFYPGRGKVDLRYAARRAIDAILRRAGKPVKEVSRADYPEKTPTYDDLLAAAQCPNAAIRCQAVVWLERYRDDQTALFFIQRIGQEKHPKVLEQIARSLGIIVLPPKVPSEPAVSASVMQKAFDTLILAAEAEPLRELKQKVAAIDGARSVLHAARPRGIHLNNIDRYKKVVRRGLSSNIPKVRVACYSACTSIAMLPPTMGETWSPLERKELQQQLAPFLDLPYPNIRLIECLGYVGDARVTPKLIGLLGHSDASVRRFAASALGQIGDLRALPALEQLAETDPHQYENGVYGVRESARRAIKLIKFINNRQTIEPEDEVSLKTNRNLD